MEQPTNTKYTQDKRRAARRKRYEKSGERMKRSNKIKARKRNKRKEKGKKRKDLMFHSSQKWRQKFPGKPSARLRLTAGQK